MTIDTTNTFGVSAAGDSVSILFNRLLAARVGILTKDEALVMAAYLVSIADPGGQRFAQVLEEVQHA